MSIFETNVDSFIPEIWAAALDIDLSARYVFSSPICTNRDYEGDVRRGSAVVINRLKEPVIESYTGVDMNLSDLETEPIKLPIEHAKAFNFAVDDITAVQAAGALLDQAITQASIGLVREADTYVGNKIDAAATALSGPIDASTGNPGDAIFAGILTLGRMLDDNDVPQEGRYLVVSPAVKEALMKCAAFSSAANYGNANPIQNGVIGSIAGFVVQLTTHLPKTVGGTFKAELYAGHPLATTYASQIEDMETIRHPARFSNIVRGLHVAGAVVTEPKALVKATVDWAA
ncbi:phage capsid protein [Streptosporangium amethystogenes subsp. fukuiense]|uniref:Phage capsid protein n=1 Tax=Streptosporangium amethystogenes subsp. fukuiense TaxID=698418 RepID=A0ABW2SQT4_9ACTN